MELLIVVLIISILIAIAIPKYQLAMEKIRATEAITVLNSLQKAVDLYVLENGYQAVNFYNLADSQHLIIDRADTFDCTQNNNRVCSNKKDFTYEDLWCNTTYCALRAVRRKSGNFSQPAIYALYMQKDASTKGKWKKRCFITPSSLSQKLCRSLEAQGWQYN